jgi:hypothetical protein
MKLAASLADYRLSIILFEWADKFLVDREFKMRTV